MYGQNMAVFVHSSLECNFTKEATIAAIAKE